MGPSASGGCADRQVRSGLPLLQHQIPMQNRMIVGQNDESGHRDWMPDTLGLLDTPFARPL